MITDNNNNWHYVTIKSISRLFRGVTSSNHGDFYCLNCLHSFRTKNKLSNHENFCINHKHCEIIMPKEGESIIKYNTGDKAIHHSHIIYADPEPKLIPFETCTPNTNNSYTEKRNTHIASDYALHLVRTCDDNLITSHRGNDCIQKFVKALKKWLK